VRKGKWKIRPLVIGVWAILRDGVVKVTEDMAVLCHAAALCQAAAYSGSFMGEV
jgi:hypothetical protein